MCTHLPPTKIWLTTLTEKEEYREELVDSAEGGLDWILNVVIKINPPPAHLNSWQKPVDTVLILDNNWDEFLLRRAAKMALGWNETGTDDGVCIPPILLAARGAALRAREWGEYYEEWEREMTCDWNCEDEGGFCEEYCEEHNEEL